MFVLDALFVVVILGAVICIFENGFRGHGRCLCTRTSVAQLVKHRAKTRPE
jgi:hypothetical protein